MTQYWLGPFEEADVEILAAVSGPAQAHAQRVLAPLTRTDDGQTTFVYSQDKESEASEDEWQLQQS